MDDDMQIGMPHIEPMEVQLHGNIDMIVMVLKALILTPDGLVDGRTILYLPLNWTGS